MRTPWKVMALCLFALLSMDARAIDLPDEDDIYEVDDYIYPGWLCEACRDPIEHPEDFAAFAYNAYWGEELWAFGSELGIPFRVYNLRLQWAVIWFEDFFFDGVSLLPNTMDIRVRLETGQIITITVIQGGPDLPVNPDSTESAPGGCGCGGGDEEVGDIEEYAEPETDLDLSGHVEIVDPDENGEFPEWEREL